jgi:hypothetical protein
MPHNLLKFLSSALAACLLASLALAVEIPAITTTTADPFSSCLLLTKNLPRDIKTFRVFAKLQKENVAACAEYAGDPPERCTAHLLTFSGLDLVVLAFENEAIPVAATMSNSMWNLLGEVRVGQKIEVLEKYYGVKIPRNTSPVMLMGECTPLVVWHSADRVAKVSLSCHACD